MSSREPNETTPAPSPAPPPPPAVRRRRRKALVVMAYGAAGFALLAALVGELFFEAARTGTLSVHAVAETNRQLARISNLRMAARRVTWDGSILRVEDLVLDAREGDTWYRLLAAERGELRLRPVSILLGRPQTLDILLHRPVIQAWYTKAGTAVLPRFHTRGGGKPSSDHYRIVLEKARVRVGDPNRVTEWWENGDLVAGVVPVPRGYEITVERASGRVAPLGLVLENAAGHARAVPDTLQVKTFSARTDAGSARLVGSLLGHHLEGSFEAERWPWEFFGDLLEQPALDVPGGVTVKGDVGGTLEHPEFATRLSGTWREEPFDGRLDGRITPRGLVLPRADLAWGTTTLAGRAEFPRVGNWTIAGTLSGVDLSRVVRLWPGVRLPPSRLAGPAQIEGGAGRLGITLSGVGGNVSGLPLSGVTGTWKIDGRRNQVDASGTAAGGAVTLRGTWNARDLDLEAIAQHGDLAQLGEFLPALRGAGGAMTQGHATLAGPFTAPKLTFQADVDSASYGGAHMERLHLAGEGGVGRGQALTLTAVARQLEGYGARADSLLAMGRYQDRGFQFSKVTAARGDTTLSFGLVAQPIDRSRWRLEADSLRLATPGWSLAATEPVRVSTDGKLWLVEQAKLAGSVGRFEASGRYGSGEDDLRLVAHDVDVGAVTAALGHSGWDGDLAGTARLWSEAGGRHLDLDLSSRQLQLPHARLDSLSLETRLTERAGELAVERLQLATGRSRLEGSGSALLAPGTAPSDLARWLTALREARQWRGDLTAENFDLSLLAPVWPPLHDAGGRVTGHVRLGGSPANPEGESSGEVADLTVLGHPLESGHWKARYANGTLTLDPVSLGEGGFQTIVTGTFPLDIAWSTPADRRIPKRPMDLWVRSSNMHLDEVAPFVSFLAAADGRAKGELHFTGVPGDVQAEGKVDVDSGVVRLAGREEVYRDLHGRLTFDHKQIHLEKFEALQGDRGRFQGSGTLTFGHEGIRYDLDVTAQQATALASGEYAVEFDGTFEVTEGPKLPGIFLPIPHVTGNLNVREGVILYDFADPQNRIYFAGPKQAPAWVYDVDVNAPGRIFWRTPSANVELKADLTVSQSVNDFRAWGTVESLRGTYYFLLNKFDVQEGVLTFDAIEPLNPRIEARAQTTLTRSAKAGNAGEQVTIELSGRVQRPTVHLSSSSGLDEKTIVGNLTYGRFFDPTATADARAIAVGTAGGQYLLRQLAREFPESSSLLNDLELGSTLAEGEFGRRVIPTVGVGRYLTPEFRVRYSQALGDARSTGASLNVRDLGAEYRINRIFYLTGEVLERRNGITTAPGSYQSELEYNLDLRARYEY